MILETASILGDAEKAPFPSSTAMPDYPSHDNALANSIDSTHSPLRVLQGEELTLNQARNIAANRRMTITVEGDGWVIGALAAWSKLLEKIFGRPTKIYFLRSINGTDSADSIV